MNRERKEKKTREQNKRFDANSRVNQKKGVKSTLKKHENGDWVGE